MFETIPIEISASWQEALNVELQKPYLLDLAAFVASERAMGKKIYPPEELVFNALKCTPFDQVKVVIVGQDPYHGAGQAHGLSFSVPPGVQPPPSLKNIYKELKEDLSIEPPNHGYLMKWAEQGVLLLNATLTVEDGKPQSHQRRGWESFTDAILKRLSEEDRPLVFILWGRFAKEKGAFLLNNVPRGTKAHHLVLTAAHPSPLSCHNGFFGCHHFSKTNAFLTQSGLNPIDWSL